MKWCIRAVWVLAVVLPLGAGAQPTDLYTCLEGGGLRPYCAGPRLGGITDIGCGQNFALFVGRIAWFPLRCVGPITIEVNARAFFSDRYPLYIEIVPVENRPCDPGYVFMLARGGVTCHYWESLGPLDITPFVPLGSSYAIQVVFFDAFGRDIAGPGLDCIRVTAHPTLSGVNHVTWALVKTLYR